MYVETNVARYFWREVWRIRFDIVNTFVNKSDLDLSAMLWTKDDVKALSVEGNGAEELFALTDLFCCTNEVKFERPVTPLETLKQLALNVPVISGEGINLFH
ncbi:hypothetical protein VNO77_23782 [Canavalia gladiata]|uniref:Uncharacterized protein n=1 Tax=Canavalia gladiata TaxID=3824 RepID=A0AAN9QC09_CANGL